MDDFEEGFSDTLVEDQSYLRDLGSELASSLEDTGYTPEQQVLALVEAIIKIADGDEDLLNLASVSLSV